MDDTELLLKELTEASGVAGYETEIRALMRKHFEPLGEVSRDRLGSLICRQPGRTETPRVMIAAHMDEIGFMVKLITPDGFIRFTTLGGWPPQYLPGHPVAVQTSKGKVAGVIGMAPPHLKSDEERRKLVESKDMFVDIGATSQADVEAAGVKPGDPIVPVAGFTLLNVPDKTYMAKAFDNRIGCAVMVAAMRKLGRRHPNALFGVATAQEEVGVRGATTSAAAVNPDVAIAVDVSPIGDVPGIKPEDASNRIGAGPALVNYDPRMIPNLKLRDMVVALAAEQKIPLQITTMEFGGYDGSAIHLYKTGVPTVVIGIPTRHVHSHNAILRRDDFDNAVKLVAALVTRLDGKTVAGFTQDS